MLSLDGPFENRPSRYKTDEEWQKAVDAANSIEDMPIMAERDNHAQA